MLLLVPAIFAAWPTGEDPLAAATAQAERGRAAIAAGEHAAGAAELLDAGLALVQLERHATAREVLAECIAPLERTQDSLRLAFARGLLACAAYRDGAVKLATPLLEAAAALAAEVGQPSLEMMVVSDLGKACRDLGRLEESGRHFERALALARQLGARSDEVVLLTQFARTALANGLPASALESVSAGEELLGAAEVPPLRLELLAARAAVCQAVGDASGAKRLLQQALVLPAPPGRLANLRGELADATLAVGELLSASSLYREVAEAAAALGDRNLLASATAGLGLALRDMGDAAAAREAFESALSAWGDDGAPANRALALMQIAELDGHAGRGLQARAQLARLDALAAQHGSRTLRDMALSAAGQLAYVERDFTAALAAAEARRKLWLDGGGLLGSALAERDVAQALLRIGDRAQAEVTARLALSSLQSLGLGRETVHLLCTLAEAALQRGDAAEAQRHLHEAARAQHDTAQGRADAGKSDTTLLGALRSSNTGHTPGQLAHDLAALRVRQAPDDPAARRAAIDGGLQACGEWKGADLAAVLALRARAGGAEQAALRAEHEQVLSLRDSAQSELLVQLARGAVETELLPLRRRIEDLGARAESLAARRAAGPSPPGPPAEPQAPGLAELRGALEAGDLYIEYAQSMERLYAYAVSATQELLVDLGSLQTLGAEVQRYVEGLSDPERLADVATVARQGRALHAALLAPLLPLAPTLQSRLHIVPCAALAGLPFEALVLSAPAAPTSFAQLVFELDRREVAYAPAGPVFVALQQAQRRAQPGRALVLGDPAYAPALEPGSASARGTRDPRRLGFVRLPGTRTEALELAARLLERARADGGSDPFDPAGAAEDVSVDREELRLLLGRAASAEALSGDLRDFALLHVAAHGHVDADDARLTGLALTPQGDDDGFLTLHDVLGLQLDADLAVLSACETGRGGERRGEGTQSLARAFLHAGARAVIASLWQVDDHETMRTMQHFHAALAEPDATVGAALRAARLAIRHAPASAEGFRGLGRGKLLSGARVPAAAADRARDLTGHPYFWAAFTLVGPSSQPPPSLR